MSSQSEVSVAAQEETSVVDALDYNSFCKLLLKFKAEDGEEADLHYPARLIAISPKNELRYIYVLNLSLHRNIWIKSKPG